MCSKFQCPMVSSRSDSKSLMFSSCSASNLMFSSRKGSSSQAHNLCFNGLVAQLERALAPQPEQHAKSSPQQAARLPSSQAALNPLSIFPLPCQSPLFISDSLSLSLHRPVPRLCPPTISSSRNRPAILR
jgi:hypothetical protein